jgi:hypothetical protein
MSAMPATTIDPRVVAQRVETLVGELGALADENARARAEELVSSLMELYGAGLERIVDIVSERGENGSTALDELTRDDLVSSLLILHGLHPLTMEARVHGALDRLRQSFGSGIELTLVSASDGRVAVQIGGRDLGCATEGLKQSIERAVLAAAPEAARVEIDVAPPPPQLIQLLRTAAAPSQ